MTLFLTLWLLSWVNLTISQGLNIIENICSKYTIKQNI